MMAENKSYVYMITCIPTSCVYIGKSNDPSSRFKSHLAESKNESSYLPLYHAIRKYGNDSFELTIIQECSSEQEAYDAERECILKLRSEGRALFNRSAGGIGNFSPTSDTRERMSKAQKGKIVTEEQRQKISSSLSGRKIPREVVEKVSAKQRGSKRTGKALDNIRSGAEKRSKDPTWVERNKTALQENRKLAQTPESRAKISKTQRTYTDEQALKLKEAYDSGVCITNLLQKFSVSIGTLYRMLERAIRLTNDT
jgi:group I intron endonuclease